MTSRPVRVLLVEDDSTVRQMLRLLLGEDHYEIIEAANGIDGMMKAEIGEPDLMIVDLMMPEVDGERMLLEIKSRSDTSHIPIVVVSGKHEALDRCKALVGDRNVFPKPFEPTKLLDRINEIVGIPVEEEV